jgi:glycosyltransferase involved in cell wall biosynthesis
VADPATGRILCFATQGRGHLDEQRLLTLLDGLRPEVFAFDHARKLSSAARLVGSVRAERPELIVMEGTGLAGGLALLFLRRALGVPYVVSSGDAVGPYLGLRSRVAGVIGERYERSLCRSCAGYIGWTPYLAGRALTFGAPRAMTAAGWARGEPTPGAREAIRARLGIPADSLVVGIVGSLNWRESIGYGYGAELVRAIGRVRRRDVVVCVVGDGSGRERLEQLADEDLGGRVVLTGAVAPEQVPDHLAAFDVASLPQSVDGVGSFRYSTKLSEYLGARLPVITGQIPMAYDLDDGGFWRLPGSAPWSEPYIDALVALLEGLTREQVAEHREALAGHGAEPFDRAAQQRRVRAFLTDIIAARPDARRRRGSRAPSPPS